MVRVSFQGFERSSFEDLIGVYSSLKVLTYSNSVYIINKAAAAEESLEIVFGREDIVGKMGQYVHFQELLRGLDFRDYGRGVRTVNERIESFKEEHVDECAGLLVATFNAEPWNDQWTLDTAKQEIRWTMEVPGFVGLVSLDEGVVAFATGYREPDDSREVFYLKTFCVRPDAQGTGVGSRLLGRLKERLGEGGVNMIYLITHKGTPAEAFYRKNGYSVSSEDIIMTQEW